MENAVDYPDYLHLKKKYRRLRKVLKESEAQALQRGKSTEIEKVLLDIVQAAQVLYVKGLIKDTPEVIVFKYLVDWWFDDTVSEFLDGQTPEWYQLTKINRSSLMEARQAPKGHIDMR
jgi:hypothetical protein